MRVARFQSCTDIFTCLYKVACVGFFFFRGRPPYRRTSRKTDCLNKQAGGAGKFLQSEDGNPGEIPGIYQLILSYRLLVPPFLAQLPPEAAQGT